jgi:hypothetical protein
MATAAAMINPITVLPESPMKVSAFRLKLKNK